MKKWIPLVVLSLAQFLMVLDQAVMNVAISQLVEDFDTTVTTIQGVITLYALVMATLMITGGKVGDIIGRPRGPRRSEQFAVHGAATWIGNRHSFDRCSRRQLAHRCVCQQHH